MSKFHLDLFSGIGGFAIAAQACGYKTIGFCEREPYAQQILNERFGAVLENAISGNGECRQSNGSGIRQPKAGQGANNHPGRSSAPILHPDIFNLDGTDYAGVDLLTGGFPCQPFSVAGKRRGAEDDRAIWPEMLRVIREAKPTWIIGENVFGIVTMELDNILSDLESLGYSAWPLVIPACAVDARHRRDRVWIIARRDVENSAGERSWGASGNALHEGRRASQTGGACIPQATRRQDGSAIGDNRAASQDVAHADERRGEQRDKNERSLSKPDSECAGVGEDVAHADESSCQGNERAERGKPKRTEHQQHCGRQLEPAICGMADGLPEGLDGGARFCQWPEEDYATPRVTTGIKHRAHRLKGLGNSIVPNVACEIIRAIVSCGR